LWNCPECGTDRHCQARVTQEGKRCRMHGGESLSGIASPQFKTGRYSKVLPTALATRYEQSLEDNELLALRDEVALLDTRLGDLLSALGVGAARKLWEDLKKNYDNLSIAMEQRDTPAAIIALHQLGEAIKTGVDENQTWVEIYTLLEQRRRLVESENKRLVQMQQVITTEQAMVLLARIQQAILQHVSDKQTLSALASEFREIVLAPSS